MGEKSNRANSELCYRCLTFKNGIGYERFRYFYRRGLETDRGF